MKSRVDTKRGALTRNAPASGIAQPKSRTDRIDRNSFRDSIRKIRANGNRVGGDHNTVEIDVRRSCRAECSRPVIVDAPRTQRQPRNSPGTTNYLSHIQRLTSLDA